jgi:hypothetical protein
MAGSVVGNLTAEEVRKAMIQDKSVMYGLVSQKQSILNEVH